MKTLYSFLFILVLCSCKKTSTLTDSISEHPSAANYIQYTISKGTHYCDKSAVTSLSLSEMKFMVKFDSSAIYHTIDPHNQKDINKLYGFSEGTDLHVNSARIGWAWYESALRLYAYVYNNSIMSFKEITTININGDINCSISVSGNNYIFKVNAATVTMPRSVTGTIVSGYQLYPYFGGDETAPSDIHIFIKDLP